MPLTLYTHDISPPGKAVQMTLKALDLEATVIQVDIMNLEHKQPAYLKINPFHQVPFLDDDGFGLGESRTIMRYLVNKYGKSDELYPKEVHKRAEVDRLLDYDLTLFPKEVPWLYSQLFHGQKANPDNLTDFNKALDDINNFILPKGGRFLTGDQYTIADLAIVGSLTFMDVVKFDYSKWENVSRWLNNCRSLPFFKEYYKCTEEWIQIFETQGIIPNKLDHV